MDGVWVVNGDQFDIYTTAYGGKDLLKGAGDGFQLSTSIEVVRPHYSNGSNGSWYLIPDRVGVGPAKEFPITFSINYGRKHGSTW